MILKSNTFEILSQLANILEQLELDEYAKPLPLLSENSIGKHVRHILEFYVELVKGINTGIIDYDLRKRDLGLETNPIEALQRINVINTEITNFQHEKALKLQVCLSIDNDQVEIETSFSRELAYNIEHTIHHFALLKIAIENYFPEVKLPSNFGVAYSTVKYQQSVCVQ